MNITEWLTTPTQEATHKKQTRQPKLTRSHNLYKTTVTVKYHGFILQTCLTLLFCKIHSKNISAVKYAQRANITSTAPQQNMLQKIPMTHINDMHPINQWHFLLHCTSATSYMIGWFSHSQVSTHADDLLLWSVVSHRLTNYTVGKNNGPFFKVYKSCIRWWRKVFHIQNVWFIIRNKSGVLNVATFKCSLHKFRETILHWKYTVT